MSEMKSKVAFWDASAIVPLCCSQPALTTLARRLSQSWERKVAWWGTTVEVYSALQRLHREAVLSDEQLLRAKTRCKILSDTLRLVEPREHVRELAEALPELYGLRALDSFQLAAALAWCKEKPRGRAFVSFDERLAKAAAKAGFSVIK